MYQNNDVFQVFVHCKAEGEEISKVFQEKMEPDEF